MKLRNTVILDPDVDEGGYTVTVPALPGCITEGDSFEEAIANAHEAIVGYVEDAVRHGEPVPIEDAGMVVTAVQVETPAVASAPSSSVASSSAVPTTASPSPRR